MNTYQDRFVIMLALLIGYEIQCTRGKDRGSSSSLNNLELLEKMSEYLDVLSVEQSETIMGETSGISKKESVDRAARDQMSWWNSLNVAIDDFVLEFERQHKASVIRVDRRLKIPSWPISSDDGFSRRYQLDFSHHTSDQVDEVQSSVIVSMPELSYLHNHGKELMLYDKEKYMFEKVLPLMYQSGKYEKLSPNFYASTESGMMIFENLNDGSRVLKKDLINSMEECKAVLKALAQFHALSVAQLDESVYSNLDSLMPVERWVSNAVKSHAGSELLTQYTKHASQLLPRSQRDEIKSMNRNLDSIIESYFSTLRDANEFTVVLQGAPQRKNLFFELDKRTSRVIRCRFFDFRFSQLGSPVLDLMSFLLSSVEFRIFKEKGDSLFEFYLEELHKSLAELKHTREYNMTMLRADLRRFKMYFIYVLLINVPLMWENQPMILEAEKLLKHRVEVLQSETFAPFFKNWMGVLHRW